MKTVVKTNHVNKKVLITGASGYLANALLPIVAQRAEVIGAARNAAAIDKSVESASLDITQRARVFDLVAKIKPDAIIHCAACNPGGSDEQMFAINDKGTKHIAQAANEFNCRLVSVSSDTVLDGTAAPYADDAPASPLSTNAYAVSKAQGEAHITSIAPNAVVVRTSLIYGTDVMDRGTAGFVERLNSGDTLSLFNDVIRQPVHDKALSDGLCQLALDYNDVAGVMTLVGDEAMSRYTFGIRMLDFWRVNYEGRVESKSAAQIPGVPLDLSVTMQRATELGLATPGVSRVLAAAIKQ